jgi:hypothetical protein
MNPLYKAPSLLVVLSFFCGHLVGCSDSNHANNSAASGAARQANYANAGYKNPESIATAAIEDAAARVSATRSSGVVTKSGAAFGPNFFADVIAADETVTALDICGAASITALQLHTNKRDLPRWGSGNGACYRIDLNQGEQITRVWGTARDQIDQLGIDTSQGRRIGPLGNNFGGAGFTQTVLGGPSGRFAGWRGLYGNGGGGTLLQLSLIQQGMGGAGGTAFVDRVGPDDEIRWIRTCWRPDYVASVQLVSERLEYALHGNSSNATCTYDTFYNGEYISEIFGRAGQYVNALGYKTNYGRTFGPYGGPGGDGFSKSIPNAKRFYGVAGASGQWLDRITLIDPMVGGAGASQFIDELPPGKTINAIRVCSGTFAGTITVIRSLEAFYDGNVSLGSHGARPGTSGLNCTQIDLNAGEYFTAMSGGSGDLIDRLKFRTNFGREFGPFGGPGGNNFAIENPWNSFLGFAGRASQAGNSDGGSIWALDFATPEVFAQSPNPVAGAADSGWWGTPATWPLLGMHAAVLPDGRMMTYGSSVSGEQGAQFTYDVWDPKLGLGPNSHLTLPNTLGVDFFCSGQTLLTDGNLLLAGGDARDRGYNRGIKQTSFFDPQTNRVRNGPLLNQARWYNTQTTLADGSIITLGGIDENSVTSGTPEVFNGSSWKQLTNATEYNVYSGGYPRAFTTRSAQGGRALWVISTNSDGIYNGKIYRLEVDANGGTGALYDSGVRLPEQYSWDRPAVLVDPNQLMVQLDSGRMVLVYLPDNGNFNEKPIVADIGRLSQPRPWSEMLVLPSGDVLVVNGSQIPNDLYKVAHHGEIWSRKTGLWRQVASQRRPRLYHSAAMLLQDGSVLSFSGGAPGPSIEKSAQRYYPGYFFNNDGNFKPRVALYLERSYLKYGELVGLNIYGDARTANLVKLGSTTHSFNTEQRFIKLNLAAISNGLMFVYMPPDAVNAPPGYYYLSVVDAQGNPSESKIVRIGF